MSPYKTNNTCDYCGRTSTLVGLYENPNKNYPTGWYCLECISRLKADGWSGSEKPTVIDGSQYQIKPSESIQTPSMWINPMDKEMEFRKEILDHLKTTADMAENNYELAWRIWQVYGKLVEWMWERR